MHEYVTRLYMLAFSHVFKLTGMWQVLHEHFEYITITMKQACDRYKNFTFYRDVQWNRLVSGFIANSPYRHNDKTGMWQDYVFWISNKQACNRHKYDFNRPVIRMFIAYSHETYLNVILYNQKQAFDNQMSAMQQAFSYISVLKQTKSY